MNVCLQSPDWSQIRVSWTRSFLTGAAIRLLGEILGKNRASILSRLGSVLKDMGRIGAFLMLISTGSKVVLRLLRELRKKEDGWNSFLAGAISSVLASLILEKSTRKTLALYSIVRSAEFLVRSGIASGWWPKKLQHEHADTMLLCASASQILWAYRHSMWSLPVEYQKFLAVHGGIPLHVNNVVSDWSFHRPVDVAAVSKYCDDLGLPLSYMLDKAGNVKTCHMIHPRKSCTHFGFSFFLAGIGRAVKVYLPISVIFTLIFRNKKILTNPVATLRGIVKSVVLSSIFLSGYCTVAHLSQCITMSKLGFRNPMMQYLTVGTAGIPALAEYKSRRLELALYCWPRALESMWYNVVSWGWVKPIPNFELAMICVAFGIMNHCYTTHRSCIRPSYRSGLCWILGDKNEEGEGATSTK